ncbi:hypothetical protein BV25DRAFT_1588701 [Artomyces pyxidatus]|uniref:Uncharacterized protein n=1 Tax=Artomyces pyxidatus TaxID=48021 RepID=A0ACB8TAV2_9AGAM|nr:hypothetical protein BV25DRAFT_1588701 [Artomyces pyxidatus]
MDGERTIASATDCWRKLSALQTLSVAFESHFFEVASEFTGYESGIVVCKSRQAIVQLHALAPIFRTSFAALRSVTLQNIIPLPIDAYAHVDSPFCGVTHLNISTASHTELEDDDEHKALAVFYTTYFPRILRGSTSTLTSLRLSAPNNVGIVPGICFDDLHYPHLERLYIRHAFYTEDAGPEPFILAHAATLVDLEVDRCLIVYEDEDGPDRTWEQIADGFVDNLPHLRVFQYEHPSLLESGYARWLEGWCWRLDDEQEERDTAALERLVDVVDARDSLLELGE